MRTKAITEKIQDNLTPKKILEDLLLGNKRYTKNNLTSFHVSELIEQTAEEHFPKAIILSCIDSRVPVEMVFDQAIGDVFVARVAGNFENTDILGSMEYSCKVAGSKLVFVLGHEGCGAVKAVCDNIQLGNITKMLENLKPAVELSEKQFQGDKNSQNEDFISNVVENNVRLTIKRIREKSSILREMEQSKEIAIVGGIYCVESGQVRLI